MGTASTTRNLSTWLEFYADLMKSNPGLARWAEASYEDLTKVTKGHLDKPDKFITTMATCSPFGAIVVHGTEGNVTILHHGTLYSRGLGMNPESIDSLSDRPWTLARQELNGIVPSHHSMERRTASDEDHLALLVSCRGSHHVVMNWNAFGSVRVTLIL